MGTRFSRGGGHYGSKDLWSQFSGNTILSTTLANYPGTFGREGEVPVKMKLMEIKIRAPENIRTEPQSLRRASDGSSGRKGRGTLARTLADQQTISHREAID